MNPTFVFVHGSNGNSFYWAPLQRELALAGHRSLAVDLPGHGYAATFPAGYQSPQDPAALATTPSAMAGITLAETTEHLAGVVRRAGEHGPVIVVAHSRGGFPLTSLGNNYPELIARMVYISAWCPVDVAGAEYNDAPENAESLLPEAFGVVVADPSSLGAIRMNWRTADPALLATLKRTMLEDGTDEEFHAVLNLLEPDEMFDVGTETDRARADTWGRVPRTYIRLTEDRSVPVALQDRFIKEADALTPGNPFDVRSLTSSHMRFVVHPAEAAAMLCELAG